jgi:hypothetical protein
LAASSPTITAGPGSTVHCTLIGKGGFSSGGAKTALKNNWNQSDHTGVNADPGTAAVAAAVAGVPNTTFAAAGPITETVKLKAACTGNAVSGSTTAPITGATIVATNVISSAGDCFDTLLGDGTASSTITWKATHAKVNPTTITGQGENALIDGHGVGFQASGGTITGSFAGGENLIDAYLDAITGPSVINGVVGPKVNSTNAANIKTLNPCEPALKVKVPSHGAPTASIKAGKGIKKIGIGAAGAGVPPLSPAAGDGSVSTLDVLS